MPWELVQILWFFFLVKHTVMDFWVQNRFPWMWMNKGRFGHPGGLAHSLTHVLGTLPFLGPLTLNLNDYRGEYFYWDHLLYFTLGFEFVVHYLIDYLKMNIGQWGGWKCNTRPYFWDLLGLDQLFHLATYWLIINVWIGTYVGV